METANRILDREKVNTIIRRMAWQIYEENLEAKQLVLAGIEQQGAQLSALLEAELGKICGHKIVRLSLSLDKHSPTQPEVKTSTDISQLTDSVVVVCDDVLNTGRTLLYALQPFTALKLAKLQIAVLVDRNHNCYPVKADYTGYALSTTLAEHVTVAFNEGEDFGAWLG